MLARPYVARVLDLYRLTPGTFGRVRPADRKLALSLYERQIPLHLVGSALLLATGRRACRPDDAAHLPRIASLHYFVPILDELIATQTASSYFRYLLYRFAPLAPQLVAAIEQPLPE